MWKYRRRLSIRPVESAITFAGTRLIIAADGRVLSPVSDKLAAKMRQAPHSFLFDASLASAPAEKIEPEQAEKIEPAPAVEPPVAQDQKVEISSDKDDTSSKRKRRSRKSAEG